MNNYRTLSVLIALLVSFSASANQISFSDIGLEFSVSNNAWNGEQSVYVNFATTNGSVKNASVSYRPDWLWDDEKEEWYQTSEAGEIHFHFSGIFEELTKPVAYQSDSLRVNRLSGYSIYEYVATSVYENYDGELWAQANGDISGNFFISGSANHSYQEYSDDDVNRWSFWVNVPVTWEEVPGPVYNDNGKGIMSSVPEPGSLALIGLGGLLIIRRRR